MYQTKWIFYSGSDKQEAQSVLNHYTPLLKKGKRFKKGTDIFTVTITHLALHKKDEITCSGRNVCTYQIVASLTFKEVLLRNETTTQKELRLYRNEIVDTARELGYCVSIIADIREADSISAINDIMTYARVNELYDPAYL